MSVAMVKREIQDNLPDECDLPSEILPAKPFETPYPNPYKDVLKIKKSMSLPCSPTDSCSSRSSDPSFSRNGAKPTHCIMCYKPADVLHYGVPACATCKTFFRRSLMCEREIHCKKKAECKKPPEYWSDPLIAQRLGQCSWCRLARFVSLGMNPCAVTPRDGKELLEYPNVAKLFETSRDRAGYNVLQTMEAYRVMRIAPLEASLHDSDSEATRSFQDDLNRTFWRIRHCDSKHRQLRASEFNPKSRNRFNWGLIEYLQHPLEMTRDIQEMIWVKNEPVKQRPSVCIKEEIDEDNDASVETVVRGSDRRRTLPLFALQKDWPFVDTICAIEYNKFFHETFELDFDLTDQIAVLQGSVIQLSLLEMCYFSWSAGFDRLTFPDGTRLSPEHARSHSDLLLSKIAILSLTRAELAIMKALLVCKADGISVRGRGALDAITLHLSKILTSVCLRKYGDAAGIARMTAIVDLFQVLEVQKSKETERHVINHLNKAEPKMSESFPSWHPILEIVFAAPACVTCILFFIILICIPLPNGCKAFLYINTVALFSMAACQWGIANCTARKKRELGPEELHFFPLVFIHQFFYIVSTLSSFYLTCERLLLCFRPTFYELHRWSIVQSLCMALLLELPLVISLTIMVQYNNTRQYAVLFGVITELTSLFLIHICYRHSCIFYSTLFAYVSLNIRYQVKEVIELTRVMLPIGMISMVLKLSIMIFAFLAFYNEAYICTSIYMLRFVATSMAYVEPILMMVRHRSMSRRVAMILSLGRSHSSIHPAVFTTEDITRTYFAALQKEWN